MEPSEKPKSSDNSDKSLNEWPTLDDVCNNTKKLMNGGSVSLKKQNGNKCNNSPPEKQNGHAVSKEDEISPPGSSGQGARKKNSSKTKWLPMPINHQPYKKRGNGRQFYDPSRINGEKKNESSENCNVFDGGRNGARGNNRSRGRRGRGYSHNFRQRREENDPSTSESENAKLKYAHGMYFNPALYDPYANNYIAPVVKAEHQIKDAIRKQIEYYFSADNLPKDTYLRGQMDSQGYVPISLIATFYRVNNLTKNLGTIVEALSLSSKLELLENAKVRPVVDPLKWPIKGTNGLRTDVPEFHPGQPYMNRLVNGINNLSFNNCVNGESLSQSPQNSLSPEQGDYCDNTNINEVYYPSSPDCYSHTPSPPEGVNGFDYYPEQISNGVYYCTPNVNTGQVISNGMSYYCSGSTPEDTDNSGDDQHDILDNKSPEPTR